MGSEAASCSGRGCYEIVLATSNRRLSTAGLPTLCRGRFGIGRLRITSRCTPRGYVQESCLEGSLPRIERKQKGGFVKGVVLANVPSFRLVVPSFRCTCGGGWWGCTCFGPPHLVFRIGMLRLLGTRFRSLWARGGGPVRTASLVW